MALPELQDIIELVRSVQSDISDEYRAWEDDDEPGIQLTVACDDEPDGGWSYQTGDNSYTGGCYSYPYWGVTGVYRDSDPAELARELVDQLADQVED